MDPMGMEIQKVEIQKVENLFLDGIHKTGSEDLHIIWPLG